MVRVHQYTSVCAVTFSQCGGIEALTGSQESVENMVRQFDRRRSMVCSCFRSMPEIELVEPKGAFYVLPYIGNVATSPEEFAFYLLDKAKIAVVPGGAFGDFAGDTIRIYYANSYEKLVRAMDQMEQAIHEYHE